MKVPHHASLSSTTRKLLHLLQPKTAVVCVAAGRPDERPHPYIVQLLKNCVGDVRFTDAVEIPGIVEPIFHESVHLEIPGCILLDSPQRRAQKQQGGSQKTSA